MHRQDSFWSCIAKPQSKKHRQGSMSHDDDGPLYALPAEIVQHIIAQADAHVHLTCRLLCQRMHVLSSDPHPWRERFRRDYLHPAESPAMRTCACNAFTTNVFVGGTESAACIVPCPTQVDSVSCAMRRVARPAQVLGATREVTSALSLQWQRDRAIESALGSVASFALAPSPEHGDREMRFLASPHDRHKPWWACAVMVRVRVVIHETLSEVDAARPFAGALWMTAPDTNEPFVGTLIVCFLSDPGTAIVYRGSFDARGVLHGRGSARFAFRDARAPDKQDSIGTLHLGATMTVPYHGSLANDTTAIAQVTFAYGQWCNGRLSGSDGYAVSRNGHTYQGGWHNGKHDGSGTLARSDGSLYYVGGWKDGLFGGWGSLRLSDSVLCTEFWAGRAVDDAHAYHFRVGRLIKWENGYQRVPSGYHYYQDYYRRHIDYSYNGDAIYTLDGVTGRTSVYRWPNGDLAIVNPATATHSPRMHLFRCSLSCPDVRFAGRIICPRAGWSTTDTEAVSEHQRVFLFHPIDTASEEYALFMAYVNAGLAGWLPPRAPQKDMVRVDHHAFRWPITFGHVTNSDFAMRPEDVTTVIDSMPSGSLIALDPDALSPTDPAAQDTVYRHSAMLLKELQACTDLSDRNMCKGRVEGVVSISTSPLSRWNGVRLDGTVMRDIVIVGMVFDECVLDGARLERCVFCECDFIACRWTGSTLHNVLMYGCRFGERHTYRDYLPNDGTTKWLQDHGCTVTVADDWCLC